ncbi:hypothetical protein LTS18_002756 [Coniosporium uncinatum]|uniref:Uncharacterized protein n=1 Tax=Coniosporium uncinatum TaxID=93489 RepID=A0ACC3D7R7_9PEZI|nr:hypothetical protein LTS18_002756 [Coniosporium uncinatum]
MAVIEARQFVVDDDYYGSWWYSPTGYIVKWIIVGIIFAIFFACFHARRRIRKGLPPLAYHRWLVPRSAQRGHHQNQYAYYAQQPPQQGGYYGQGNAYGMQTYAEPPPQYNHNDVPPTYQPPQGGSKADPSQLYMPPAGPPPAGSSSQETGVVAPAPAVRSDGTGNPFRYVTLDRTLA